MGLIDVGSQLLYFDFKHPADSDEFNRLLRNIVKPGVYKGGSSPSHLGGNVIRIPPFQAFCNTRFGLEDELAVRVITQTNSDIGVTQITPSVDDYIYLQMVWINAIENYADFKTRSVTDSPAENEVILARVQYDGGGNVTAVDEVGKTWGLFDDNFNTIVDTSLILRSSYLQLEAIPVADVPAAPGTGKAVIYKKEGDGALIAKNENDPSEINLLDVGGTGAGFSPMVAQFGDSFFKAAEISEFAADNTHSTGNLLINGGATTATEGSKKYIFDTPPQLFKTNNLIDSSFKQFADVITKSQILLRWTDTSGKADPVSKLRVSRNGELSSGYGIAKQSLIKEGDIEIITSYNNIADQDSNIALSDIAGNQTRVAQGIQYDRNFIIYGVRLYLKRLLIPGGRFRVTLLGDNSGPNVNDVRTFSEWQTINNIDTTGFNWYHINFEFGAYLLANTDYYITVELEMSDEYDYTAATEELQIGVDSSSPTYTNGTAWSGNSSLSSIAGTDLIFEAIGRQVINSSELDISRGIVELDDKVHYRANRIITDYPQGNSDSALTLNNTTQQRIAQKFRVESEHYKVSEIDIELIRTGTPGGQIEVYIYSDNGTGPEGALVKADTGTNSDIISVSKEIRTFKFTEPYELQSGIDYWVVVDPNSNYTFGANFINVGTDTSIPSYDPGGVSVFDGTNWNTVALTDLVFVVKGGFVDTKIRTFFDKANVQTFEVDITGLGVREQLAVSFELDTDSVMTDFGLLLERIGTPSGNCYIEIYSDNTGQPGTLLESSDQIPITDISTTLENIKFGLRGNLQLSKNTPYWLVLRVTSDYHGSYANGVTEIHWYADSTNPNYAATYASSEYNGTIWSTQTHIFSFIAYGFEAELILEATAYTTNAELVGFGAAYLFNDIYRQPDSIASRVILTDTMKSNGIVPHGLQTSGTSGSIIAFVSSVPFVGGFDASITQNEMIFNPVDISTESEVIFIANKISTSFENQQLLITENIRNLPDPIINKFDNETIEFTSTGGVNQFKVDIPGEGSLIGQTNARVSFLAGKNQYGGIGLDTGSESSDTEYYIYAVKRGITNYLDFIISNTKPSNGGPLGYLRWKYLGRFWNDNSSNIIYPFSDFINLRVSSNRGSTNTNVRRWDNIDAYYGSCMTLSQSATLGDSIEINKEGLYSFTLQSSLVTSGITNSYIMLNSISTGNPDILNTLVDLSHNEVNTSPQTGSGVRYLNAGDIIRVTSTASDSNNSHKFYISRITPDRDTIF